MNKKIKFLTFFFVLGVLGIFPFYAWSFSFPDFKDIRSVTFYPFPPFPYEWTRLDESTLESFRADLKKVKALGFNSIWFVIPWKGFEPVALPQESRQYNQTAFDNLKQVVGILEQENMVAILPINYFGVGWSPQGIDSRKWLFDHQMWGAFYGYVVKLSESLKNYKNVLFLLFSEGVIPGPKYFDFLRSDPDVSQHFRNWAFSINSDLSYWNSRWGLSYKVWKDVLPISPSSTIEYVNQNRWVDHGRWSAYIIRNTLGTLSDVIKRVNSNAKVGFHDCCILAKGKMFYLSPGEDQTPVGSPIPDVNSFDVFSIASYPNTSFSTSTSYWVDNLRYQISNVKNKHPNLPIFIGETGIDTATFNEQQQKEIMRALLKEAESQGIGFNIWAWKDFSFSGELLGLFDANYQPKYLYRVIKSVLLNSDLNDDGLINSDDLNILKSQWGSLSKPKADINKDGIVNSVDLGILMSDWGSNF